VVPIPFQVDGRDVEVADDGASLLEVLRDRLGIRSPKDGCSPQGQCGCCTVLVDGRSRVACVTPVRRVAGRRVTTLTGLDPSERARWAEAFTTHGASQCGFCTPGIIVRLAALAAETARGSSVPGPGRPGGLTVDDVEGALVAHLCRCTGWQTIVEAALDAATVAARRPGPLRDLGAAAARAGLEGGTPQRVGPEVALGEGGFADDGAPLDALVAVPDGADGWAVADTLSAARALAGKVQGRRTTAELTWPLEVAAGDWDLTLRTTWVEPAYLEPDASWCLPGGDPAAPLANGGAFGAKVSSPVMAAARQLADRHQRAVRVLLAREDIVRIGPKRPPVAVGIRRDGTGVLRVVRAPGIAAAVASVAPGLTVEEIEVAGPPVSAMIRAAGWAEAAVLLAALEALPASVSVSAAPRPPVATVVSPSGGWATATVGADRAVAVRVAAGRPLDETVLRSYGIGAAHQAIGWVTSEAIAVDGGGAPRDLTVRSFGILRARDMPSVTVEIVPPGVPPPDRPGPAPVEPVNGSDAVFAAVAAAVWIAEGLPRAWPTHRARSA